MPGWRRPWAGSRPPLESLAGKKTLTCPDLPHVEFALPDRKFIPVSVNEDMVGHKLGEFAPTRTFFGHAADKKGKR